MTNDLAIIERGELAPSSPESLNNNPAAVYLAGLNSAGGRRTQLHSLDTIAALLLNTWPEIQKNACLTIPWAGLRYAHTQAIRAKLAEHYSANSANRMISALRGALGAAFNLGQLGAEDYTRAIKIKNVTGETIPAGRELSPGELAALMQNCENDPTPAGARDAAIIALAYSCGLRREEIVSLDLSNYDQATGKLVILGKRNKQRTAYLVNGSARAMADWLKVRGDLPGPLFLPINKAGKLASRRMTNQAVYNLLQKRGEPAGVKDFSPHDLRRTFVSDLLEAGADIATVQKMAGHSSVTTTARYDRRPEQAKQKAAGLLHVPYHGRKG